MRSSEIDKIESLFEDLNQFERIEVLSSLTRIREPGHVFTLGENSSVLRHASATIPRIEDYHMDYGRGFITVGLTLHRSRRDEDIHWTVLSFTNIDDGSWTFHGQKQERDAAEKQYERVLDQIKTYDDNKRWPPLDQLKKDMQPMGLYIP